MPPPLSTWPPQRADADAKWIEGTSVGPLGAAPDRIFEATFRSGLVAELGRDVAEPGFSGIIALVRALVAEGDGARGVSSASRRVLVSLFPDWPPFAPEGRRGLLYWFEVLFARPFPAFSAKLNAWVTWWAAQWLMGPCTLEDLRTYNSPAELEKARREFGGGSLAATTVGDGVCQELLVRRCRFLEESACASVCVNACKMPTQEFFNKEMGVPMRMLPDYETLQCRFQFGVPPTEEDEDEARRTPCFTACSITSELVRDKPLGAVRCHSMGGRSSDEA
jgi:hypothetical protein